MSIRCRTSICALAAFAAGCASFGPPRAATLARLAPMAIAARPFERFELEIASPALTGTFDGVIAGTANGFALQLFPDVGGKVLELEVDLATAVATGTTPSGPLEPRFATVLAAMFAELRAPVVAERVRGERVAGGGAAVELRAAFGDRPVVAALDSDGAVAGYTFDLGAVGFALRADGSFDGPRFRGRLQIAAPATSGAGGAVFHSPGTRERATIEASW